MIVRHFNPTFLYYMMFIIPSFLIYLTFCLNSNNSYLHLYCIALVLNRNDYEKGELL